MSHAATITLTGRAGTNPQVSNGSTGDRVNLRVVATERRFDRTTGEWTDGDEFGVTVICWRTLASAVLATVRKGDPVIVCGRIATRRFERDGMTQYFTEVKADSIGLDLARASGRFVRAAPDTMQSPPIAGATTDPAGIPVGAVGGTDPAADPAIGPDSDLAEQLPQEPDDFDDPWGLRNESPNGAGELVPSG